MRPPKPTEDSPKCQAILKAALELFAERGFHGTAVPLVAQRAGVGCGTMYRYFRSKDALVNALFQTWKGELASALVPPSTVGVPPRQLFHQFWRSMAQFAKKHPMAVVFLELNNHRAYMDKESEAMERRLLEPIRGLIQVWQEQQIIKPIPADVLMAMVWGAFVGILRASWMGHVTITPDTLSAAENCMWEAIRR